MKFNYNIGFFSYSKTLKTLYAKETDLHIPNFAIPFPNGPQQFNIINPKTNQFRRFRLVFQDDKIYSFKSEDGFYCNITKQIF